MYVTQLTNAQISEIATEIIKKREGATDYIITDVTKNNNSVTVNITATFKGCSNELYFIMLDNSMMYRINGFRLEPNEYYRKKMAEWFGQSYATAV